MSRRVKLLEVERDRAYTSANRALVKVTNCPSCGEHNLDRQVVDEPALVRHGGYGATKRTIRLYCHCGWYVTAAIEERRP